MFLKILNKFGQMVYILRKQRILIHMGKRKFCLKIVAISVLVILAFGTFVPTITAKQQTTEHYLNTKIFKDSSKGSTLITISARDFCKKNEQYHKAILFFKSDVTVEIKDIQILDHYENLNGIYAIIPQSLGEYLKQSWFTDSTIIFEHSLSSEYSSFYCPQDTLDWGVDDIDAEKVFGIFTRLPEREEIVIPVEERLIVELYSK